MKLNQIEIIIIGLIVMIGLFTLIRDDEPKEVQAPIVDDFDDYPLVAWRDTDERGNTIKIKYGVEWSNTTVWIRSRETNEVVHQQPFDMNPYPRDHIQADNKRVYTYTWKLYRTERSAHIPNGSYQIVVGPKHNLQSSNNLFLDIDI